jgi:putative FmdB family regulatory protein
MPTYTYQCASCGVVFDRVQSFHDKPLTKCPECEGDVRRLLQPSAIVFKGSGWYATDNRSPSGQNNKKGDKAEKSGDGEKTATPAATPAKTESAN